LSAGTDGSAERDSRTDRRTAGLIQELKVFQNLDMKSSNIVLIGMPGSGKSTLGVMLAKQTSRDFVDTDILIQSSEKQSLQSILDTRGYLALRSIEERILCGLNCSNHVIATGGSAVYSHAAMEHLRQDGLIIFLDVALAVLESRDLGLSTRGIAKRPDQSFADLYAERCALYLRYADVVIDCSGLTHEKVCSRVIDSLS
jgi:shikimate kinase